MECQKLRKHGHSCLDAYTRTLSTPFELLLDIVELDTEVVVDIENHIELLVKAKSMPAFTSLLAFAAP